MNLQFFNFLTFIFSIIVWHVPNCNAVNYAVSEEFHKLFMDGDGKENSEKLLDKNQNKYHTWCKEVVPGESGSTISAESGGNQIVYRLKSDESQSAIESTSATESKEPSESKPETAKILASVIEERNRGEEISDRWLRVKTIRCVPLDTRNFSRELHRRLYLVPYKKSLYTLLPVYSSRMQDNEIEEELLYVAKKDTNSKHSACNIQ